MDRQTPSQPEAIREGKNKRTAKRALKLLLESQRLMIWVKPAAVCLRQSRDISVNVFPPAAAAG